MYFVVCFSINSFAQDHNFRANFYNDEKGVVCLHPQHSKKLLSPFSIRLQKHS